MSKQNFALIISMLLKSDSVSSFGQQIINITTGKYERKNNIFMLPRNKFSHAGDGPVTSHSGQKMQSPPVTPRCSVI